MYCFCKKHIVLVLKRPNIGRNHSWVNVFWAFGANHSRGKGIVLNSFLITKSLILILTLMEDFWS